MTSSKTSVILMAGGIGSRMQSEIPKQFLMLGDKSVAKHSFDLFLGMDEIDEVVVVCSPKYQSIFKNEINKKTVRFALPGERRQDSAYNGLMQCQATSDIICIHDAARPLIDSHLVRKVIQAAQDHGAATAGMPLRYTVKQSDKNDFVQTTLNRDSIWEIQTPQAFQHKLLLDGFAFADEHHLTVTDETTLVEFLKRKVKLVEGLSQNIKITVPFDLTLAEQYLKSSDSHGFQ